MKKLNKRLKQMTYRRKMGLGNEYRTKLSCITLGKMHVRLDTKRAKSSSFTKATVSTIYE